ncbi:MAG: HAD-IC family P-type ATPase [Thermoplasmata archaeon]
MTEKLSSAESTIPSDEAEANSRIKWHTMSPETALKQQGSRVEGLSGNEAKRRLAIYGLNEIISKKRSALIRFLLQFHNPMMYVLLFTGAVTMTLSLLELEDLWPDTFVIFLVIVVNAIIGFIQEGKAEAAIDALKKMMVPECKVVRDGEAHVIKGKELVPGDIVLLEAGDRVPADMRLVHTKNFAADESLLTGESQPVSKDAETQDAPDIMIADMRGMAFSGTFATRGLATGLVISTGEWTEVGKVARMVKEVGGVDTPLLRNIAQFTNFLIVTILTAGGILAAIAYVLAYTLIESFMAAVSMAVAAIPEMLPALVISILALSSMRMAKRNSLIRKLPAIETLGCTTVICSDKTGTLTQNEMTVVNIYAGGKLYEVSGKGYAPEGRITRSGAIVDGIAGQSEEFTQVLNAGALCNNAQLDLQASNGTSSHVVVGDPTEGALIVSARKAGLEYEFNMVGTHVEHSRMDEIPFDSSEKYMAVLTDEHGENIIYVKGSVERLLGFSSTVMKGGKLEPIDEARILKQTDELSRRGLRVLAMAMKRVPDDQNAISPADMNDLVFLGMQAMYDPPREGVPDSIAKCKLAGIRPVMITGDHPKTAQAISRQIGIIKSDDARVLTGAEMSGMTDDELFDVVNSISVYARATPEHKLRIAMALKKHGHVVAMTGDGVNDAPALKAANIGVAMGTGTEVSKEASDMVIADDNFATIVDAVEQGRHAWKNLQKAILYTLPTNGGQAALMIGGIILATLSITLGLGTVFDHRLPLEPIHILWINLADSVFLTMPLMMEPMDRGLLREKPRNVKEKIANRMFFIRVGLVSIVMLLVSFFVYWYYGTHPDNHDIYVVQAQTAAFISLQMVHIGYLMTARSIEKSAFRFSPFSNRWVLAGIFTTVVTALLITYTSIGNAIFRTEAIPLEWWPVLLLCLVPGFAVIEVEKYFEARKKRKKGKARLSQPGHASRAHSRNARKKDTGRKILST